MLHFGDRMAGLATVCASILCLVPAQRVSADPPELALALEGGVAWSHSSHTYQFFDPEDGPNDAGIDAGYRWLLGERWSIGLGGSVSTQWSFFGESGDHGRYEYTQGAVWPAVHLRVAHL